MPMIGDLRGVGGTYAADVELTLEMQEHNKNQANNSQNGHL